MYRENVSQQLVYRATLTSTFNELELSVPPAPLHTRRDDICKHKNHALGTCDHEIWLRLNLDSEAWEKYSKFTLRISWPASVRHLDRNLVHQLIVYSQSPADFYLDTFAPTELADVYRLTLPNPDIQTLTRTQYARIRVVNTGIRTPWPGVNVTAPPPDVRFRVICEPLLLGILPQTLLPTIVCLIAVIAVASTMVCPINRYLGRLSDEVRDEISKRKIE
jgi:hypothetical protein